MVTANNRDVMKEIDIHLQPSESLIEFCVKWTVKNFSQLPVDVELESPLLEPAPECRLILQIVNDSIEYYLSLKNESNQIIKAQTSVSILDCEGELWHSHDFYDTYYPNRKIDILNGEELYSSLLNFKDDIVIFVCDLKITRTIATTCLRRNFTMDKYNGRMKLCEDLKTLLDDNTHADVTLKVGGAQIPANKAILSARSAVFEKMFCRNMDEQDNGCVQVDDVSLPVLKKLVEFLYTGDLDVVPDIATVLALYYAADKYKVLDLRKICADTLLSSIAVDNVTEILVTAYRHGDEYLKNQALVFLRKNINCIMESEKWNEFMTAHSKFAAQVLEYCVKSIKKKKFNSRKSLASCVVV